MLNAVLKEKGEPLAGTDCPAGHPAAPVPHSARTRQKYSLPFSSVSSGIAKESTPALTACSRTIVLNARSVLICTM